MLFRAASPFCLHACHTQRATVALPLTCGVAWPAALAGWGNAGANASCSWHVQGIGLVWPTNIGLLEVNWCRVLAHQPTDTVRHGLEVGFSPITS